MDIVTLAIFVVVIYGFASGIRIVRPVEVGIVEFLGKYSKLRMRVLT